MEENILKAAKNGLTSTGKTLFLKFATGEKLGARRSIEAHCYQCTGYYADGRQDCENTDCPLYPYMPYGQVWKNREKKTVTEEFRQAAAERFKKARENNA